MLMFWLGSLMFAKEKMLKMDDKGAPSAFMCRNT